MVGQAVESSPCHPMKYSPTYSWPKIHYLFSKNTGSTLLILMGDSQIIILQLSGFPGDKAGEIARGVKGVKSVKNNLNVKK
jgi:hypothetical protein